MESRPATMAKASRMAVSTRLRRNLPEEIAIWEILVRLPPKSLLRCRAVCRTWRRATSTRHFLLAHHHRQPSLPIVSCSGYGEACHKHIFAFDHQAAGDQLQPVVQLNDSFCLEASCDGLLILSKYDRAGSCFSVSNPATRQHARLPQLSDFDLLGMYLHLPTSEYRLLLQLTIGDNIGCYVFALGSDQPPRYIGELEMAESSYLLQPALLRDRLHWYPVHCRIDPQEYRSGSTVVIVFDTISESFRHMRAPDVPAKSYILEMDGTLGIYSYNTTAKVDIWMLGNYETEVWRYMHSVKLPATEIKWPFGWLGHDWHVSVQSVDGNVLVLVTHGGWMHYVDVRGKLVKNFCRENQRFYANLLQLRQTLVPHNFFSGLEGYVVNASPFV